MPDFFTSKVAEQSPQYVAEPKQKQVLPVTNNTPILQDHYVLIGPLGQGGMGAVFMAQDTSLFNRLCVVKKLKLEGFNDRDKRKATEFFQREAKILSDLKHPNVVHIQAYFQEQGNYYLVMEYVEGNNLLQLLRKRGTPFEEQQVIEWATTILNVLHYLHNHEPSVIYRDIKPSNIMLDTVNGIKLVDFGIARPYTENSENTHVVSGGYSPPEQYWGAADPRSDIYALGATMHYLLTGQEPVALQSCSPKLYNHKVSDFIDKIVQRATSQDVWLRYQTATEMLAALNPSKAVQPTIAPKMYIALTCLTTLVCVLSLFLAFDYFTNQPPKTVLHSMSPTFLHAKNKEQNRSENTEPSWSLPLSAATLADSEEILTDPQANKAGGTSKQTKGNGQWWPSW